MSSDIRPDEPPRMRCEAISSTSSPSLACYPAHGAVLHYPGPSAGRSLADDPARLIGLALSHVREGEALTGIVPDAVIDRLQSHADNGNAACRLLLDWLATRNDQLVTSAQPDADKAQSIDHRLPRRMVRGRRQAGPGSLKKHRPPATQATDSETAIIAAHDKGRIDE